MHYIKGMHYAFKIDTGKICNNYKIYIDGEVARWASMVHHRHRKTKAHCSQEPY